MALRTQLGLKGDEVRQAEKDRVAAQRLVSPLKRKVSTMESTLFSLRSKNKSLQGDFERELKLRQKLHNQVEDLKGNIRVFARVRPLSGKETEQGCTPCLSFLDEKAIVVEGGKGAKKKFTFDRVFTEANAQDAVFEDTKHLIRSACDGFNVCIFAYGQTGSGKTYTMVGEGGWGVEKKGTVEGKTLGAVADLPEKAGIAPRAVTTLFELIQEYKYVSGGGSMVSRYIAEGIHLLSALYNF